MASVTLYLSGSFDVGANNFTLYHSTLDPSNAIATGISAATLANGYCTEEIYPFYVVQSNTDTCTTSYYVTVSGVPTPTPTATGLPVTPTATPTPTAIVPTATATPTPTPTPTQAVWTINRSNGSTDPDQCAATLTDVVYTDTIIPLWQATNTRVYTDAALTTGLPGGNNYFRFTSGSSDRVWSVNNTGLISTQGEICENIYEFYTNAGFLTDGEECNATTGTVRYSPDFSSVADMQVGDRIYADATLQFQLNDQYFYGASDTLNGVPEKVFEYYVLYGVQNLGECGAGNAVSMSSAGITSGDACTDTTPQFQAYVSGGADPYNLQIGDRLYGNSQLTQGFGQNDLWYGVYSGSQASPVKAYKLSGTDPFNGYIEDVVTCATPTATPTPSPSPTPLVSWELQISDGSVNSNQCGASFTGTVWTSTIMPLWTANGQRVYTDQNLTVAYNGGNEYHRISSGSSDRVWSVSPTGLVSVQGPICENIYEFYTNPGFLVDGQECIATASTARYTTDFTTVADMEAGDRIYADNTLQFQLNDGYYYGASDVSGSTPDVAFKYSVLFGAQNIGDCGAGTAVSMSSAGITSLDACNDTTPQFQAYISGNVDPYNLQVGDRLFSNPQLTDGFGQNDLWYGVYSGSQASPIKAYKLSGTDPFNGYVQDIAVCPTPTATPLPTPSPTPLVFYPISASAGNNDQDQCGASLTQLLYTDRIINTWTANNNAVWTDQNLTTRYDGGNQFYRFVSGSDDEVWSVNATGVVSVEGPDCANIQEFFSNAGFLVEGTECFATASVARYSPSFSGSVDNMPAGAKIYSDSSYSVELNDGYYYGFADTSGSVPSVAGQYNLINGIQNLGNCQAGVGFDLSSLGISSTDACNDTTPQYVGYVTGSKDYLNLQLGDVIYDNPQLTDTFGSNNVWYGVYSGSQSSPVKAYELNNGAVIQIFTCPVPTPPPPPTPSPTPFINYPISASDSSTSPDLCGQPLVNNYHMANPIQQFAVVFTDPTHTTPLLGANRYYRLATGSIADEVWSISNAGVLSAPGPNCSGSLYEFQSTNALNTGDDACSQTLTSNVYTLAFTDVLDILPGDRIYTSAALTTELQDGKKYGLANSGSSEVEVQITYNLINGAQSIGFCQQATAVSMSSEFISPSDSCSDTTPQYLAYVTASLDPFNLQLGDVFYDDSTFTSTFGSSNVWYGVYSGSRATPEKEYKLLAGEVIQINACPAPTPEPTPPPPTPVPTATVYGLNCTTGQPISGVVCTTTTGALILYSTSSRGSDVQNGDVLYTDQNLTTPYNGGAGLGQYFGIGLSAGTSAPDIECRINSVGVVSSRVACPPPPTPQPTPPPTAQTYLHWRSSTGRTSTQDACADTSRLNAIYSQKLAQDMTQGDTFYTDQALTTPFNGGGQYWSWENQNGSNPRAGYINSSGTIQFFNPVNCPS